MKVEVDLDLDGGARSYADAPDLPLFEPTVDLDGRRDTQTILRRVRRYRFPELFQLRWSRAFIDLHVVSDPSTQALVQRGLRESTDPEDKFVVILHPAFKRHAIMELVRNPQDGGACYKTAFVAQEDAEDNELPVDLCTEDRLFEHLRGMIGRFKPLDQRDVEILRHYGDRRLPDEVIDQRLQAYQEHVDGESERVLEDMNEDFHDYYFLAINTAANDGRKQYVFQNEAEVQRRRLERPTTCRVYQRDGFKIRVRQGSRLDEEYADRVRRLDQLERKLERQRAMRAHALQTRQRSM
jgi:hypothetical protein